MRLDACFSSFLRQKQIENRTEKTIEDYKAFIAPFVRFIGADFEVSTLPLEKVEDYILSLYNRKLADASVSCYIRHVKAFLSFIEKKYSLPFSASEIKVPKYYRDEPYLFTPDDIQLIFSSIDLKEEWITVRNRAVIALMLDSGLRQSEVCSLEWEWVDFAQNQIKVKGKGRKYRHVPLGHVSAQFLTKYAVLCPFSGTPYVFSERRGGQLQNSTVKKFVYRLSKRLPFPFYSHLCRHNFATNWCLNQYEQNGKIDIFGLKAILGHTDIKTTERYLHYAQSQLAVRTSLSHLDKVLLSDLTA